MKYGDAVVLVVNDRPSNALVLQSNAVDGEEHLTLISLDPKHNDSTILSGEQMRQAVITGYGVEPVKEGKHAGWRLSWDKPVESEEDGKPTGTLMDDEVAVVIREQLGKGEQVQPPNGANLQQVFTTIAAYNRETLERLNNALTNLESAKSELEQTRVQLAGCSVAALGWSNGEQKANPGDWGYSASYQDVLDLRGKYEALLNAQTQGVKAPTAPDGVAPEITQDDAASLAALSGSGGLAGQTGAEVSTQAEAPQSTPEA